MVIALVMPSEKQLSEFLNFAKQNPFVKIIVFEEHLNVYETWNKCIKESDQEFLTTVNSDDFRFQHSMCLQREALKDSSADILFSDVAVIEGDHSVPARLFSVPRFFQLRHLIFQGINIPHAMPAWRRELHERLGFFDENLESSADVEFWLRCLLSNKVFMKGSFVPGIYFLNPEGVSTKQGSKGPENWAQIMDRYAWRILMKLMSPRKKESSATLT